MKRIFKHTLAIGPTVLSLPEGAKILCVQLQRNYPTMWVEVDTSNPKVDRAFQAVATGGGVPESATYLGTCLLDDDSYVLHFYEVPLP